MRYIDTLRYEMLVRARDFGAERSATFPASTLGGQLFAQVSAAVLQLSQHAANEASGRGTAREGTSTKALARKALKQQLNAIGHTARALAVDRPGLDDKFRLPRAQSDQTLLSTARAFAQDAAPLASDFITHAMPATFLDELNAGIARFEQSIHDHQAGTGTHMTASASIKAGLEAGLTAVRRLDAIVANQLRDDPVTIALWEHVRHVPHPAQKKAGDPAPPAATPSTTPVH